MNKHKLSVIIPVYYNAESLEELYERVTNLTQSHPSLDLEILFVDDGSGDNSFDVIQGLCSRDDRVVALKLSRNFGSFNACLAGLTRATGECAVIISADLQDPPEIVGEMYERWLRTSKVVMAVRERREEPFLKVLLARIYYRVFRALVDKAMPRGGFDFVLIDRAVVDNICAMQEKNTTLMGLILWSGFKREEIPYTRMKRKYGKSRWSLAKKVNYFADSMLAFTQLPIRLVSLLGVLTCFISFVGIIYIFIAAFLGRMTVAGWASLMVVILFMFSIMMIGIGVLGEYVWRSLEESRKRPSFIIESEYRRGTESVRKQ
ncbi:MAG: glycosyltransferase family 2 protein [Candidatus Krumholzibacteria bacterium]|nr:glycosyltransferase family 2 protein [Candidatus Krumholzibacteria bacterium]